jgi:hypothetical protein
MAAYELTIKAMSRTDLETAVLEAADWFRPVEDASGDRNGAAEAPPRPRGRPRSTGKPVPAAAHTPAAGEALTNGGATGGGDGVGPALADAADGDAGAVGSTETAQDTVEAGSAADGAETGAAEETAPAEAEEAQAPAEGSAADADDAGASAGQAAADAQDPAGDADGAAAVGEGTAEITIDTIKTAASDLIGKKGFQAVKKLFAAHDIQKPGATPPEKFAAVMADLQKELG